MLSNPQNTGYFAEKHKRFGKYEQFQSQVYMFWNPYNFPCRLLKIHLASERFAKLLNTIWFMAV